VDRSSQQHHAHTPRWIVNRLCASHGQWRHSPHGLPTAALHHNCVNTALLPLQQGTWNVNTAPLQLQHCIAHTRPHRYCISKVPDGIFLTAPQAEREQFNFESQRIEGESLPLKPASHFKNPFLLAQLSKNMPSGIAETS
jgi:hypothetical protein